MKSLHLLLPPVLVSYRGALAFTPSTAPMSRPMPLAGDGHYRSTASFPSSLSKTMPMTSLASASGDDDDDHDDHTMIIMSKLQEDLSDELIIRSSSKAASPPPSSSYNKRSQGPKKNVLQERKRDWINRSLTYYSTVSREAKRRENGQYVPSKIELAQYRSNFITAKKLYFARHKIKSNQPRHAERIYRKLIDDLVKELKEEESCDHAQIAISTLLLALLLQRQGEIKETRATFIRFFRLITVSSSSSQSQSPSATPDGGFEFKECTCSAKVLQAFALFEMKQKNVKKAYALIQMAVKLDSELEPVLQWKQFRDAKDLIQSGRNNNRRRKSSHL